MIIILKIGVYINNKMKCILEEISREEYSKKLLTYNDYDFENTLYFDSYAKNLSIGKIYKYFKFSSGESNGLFILRQYYAKRMKYLWVRSGPVWNKKPNLEDELDFLKALYAYAEENLKEFDYIRLMTYYDHNIISPENVPVSYNKTVYIKIEDDIEKTYLGFKKRGRRDLRKALREAKFSVNDETNITREDFQEIYDLIDETQKRHGGFPILTIDKYWIFLKSLREENIARLFTVRDENNKPISWAIIVIYGDMATYYFAASNKKGQENFGPDLIIANIVEYLVENTNVKRFDLMGIGSDYLPAIKSLTMFKTKFSKDIVETPVYRELVINKTPYKLKLFLSNAKNKILKK